MSHARRWAAPTLACLGLASLCACGDVDSSSDEKTTTLDAGSSDAGIGDGGISDSSTDSDASPTDAGASDGSTDAFSAPVGPFDIELTNFVVSAGPEIAPGAAGTELRVDFTSASSAVLSPLFHEPGIYSVSIADDAITLDGSLTIYETLDCTPTWVNWSQIRVFVDAAGVPTGQVEATGLRAWEGSAGLVVTAVGSIAPDGRAPSFQLVPPKFEGGSLPWNQIVVTASEPIPSAAFLAAASVIPNPASIELLPETYPAALGSRRAAITLTSWTALLGLSGSVEPVADDVGNLSLPWTEPLPIFDLGPAQSGHTFSTATGVTFGGGTWVDASTQALCNTDGCVQLPPALAPAAPTAGIAGRFATGALTEISVRYRHFLVLGGPGVPPSLELEVAAPGVEPSGVTIADPGAFQQVNGTYATDWSVHSLTLPSALSAAPELGFVIRPVTGNVCTASGTIFAYLLVDEVLLK